MIKPITFLITGLLLIPSIILAQQAHPETFIPRNCKVAEESGFPVNLYEHQSENVKENKWVIPPYVKGNDESDEEAVWKLEEVYWGYVKNYDLVGYRSLWDEGFLGWPHLRIDPKSQGKIANWVPLLHEDPARVFDFNIQKKEGISNQFLLKEPYL